MEDVSQVAGNLAVTVQYDQQVRTPGTIPPTNEVLAMVWWIPM
jgi:hypothetical protein